MSSTSDRGTAEPHGPLAQPQPLWQHIGLFEGLDAPAFAAISERFQLRSFSAGDVLIQQDCWCGELFILRSGVAQVSYEQSGSQTVPPAVLSQDPIQDVVLRRLVSGDCFGEMSLITGAPPSATIRALTEGDAWTLRHDDFQQLALDYPRLTRNINVILSERLFHTSRQHAQHPPQQITLVVAETSPLWDELTRALAVLTGHATLFVAIDPPTDQPRPVYHLEDLLSGRLNGARKSQTDRPDWEQYDAIVLQDSDTDASHITGTIAELLGALSRLEDFYRHVLIMIPPHSPHLTASLLAVATRVLVAGPIRSSDTLRSLIAGLPMPASLPIRPEVGVIMTDAHTALSPSVGTIDRLSGHFGAPVRAIIPATASARANAVAALARWIVGQRIGLALGGGGVKGWAHLGVLRVLRRLRVPFDCVTGVSIGAICAAMIARGGTLDEYENLLRAGSAYAFHPKISRVGLLNDQAVARFLRRTDVLGERLIEELSTPFAAVAADLYTGSEIVIRRGLAWQAVLASTAIPALFPPVRMGGYCLVDGTVVNPVPISTAQILGADKVIAVDISAVLSPRQEISDAAHRATKLPNMVGSMLRSFEIMAAQIRARSVEEPSVLIKPDTTAISLRRFGDGAQFIGAGEAAAEAALPQLFREFPWLERMAP